jgi:hypothetical protein
MTPKLDKSSKKWELWLKADCGCQIYHRVGAPLEGYIYYKEVFKKGCKLHNE